MARDARYNVRVTFINGNSITLDCRGCGQIYIEPNHDYFFEQAPIKFINYLAQLRRVGITYKITEDKRGCYRTFNLLKYEANDVGNMISKMRANRTSAKPIVEEKVVTPEEEIEEVPPVEEPPKGAPELPTEITNLDTVTTPSNDDESDIPEASKSDDPIAVTEGEDIQDETDGVTTEVEPEEDKSSTDDASKATEEGEPITEGTSKATEEELEAMNKKELIDYAHSLGLVEITDAYTKKEIRTEIQKLD